MENIRVRTTTTQDRSFIDFMFSNALLEEAIEFIKNNFGIEELYGEDTLHDWATENGYSRVDED